MHIRYDSVAILLRCPYAPVIRNGSGKDPGAGGPNGSGDVLDLDAIWRAGKGPNRVPRESLRDPQRDPTGHKQKSERKAGIQQNLHVL